MGTRLFVLKSTLLSVPWALESGCALRIRRSCFYTGSVGLFYPFPLDGITCLTPLV